jgi:hypothetical protein
MSLCNPWHFISGRENGRATEMGFHDQNGRRVRVTVEYVDKRRQAPAWGDAMLSIRYAEGGCYTKDCKDCHAAT